jgi:hypothetical protein
VSVNKRAVLLSVALPVLCLDLAACSDDEPERLSKVEFVEQAYQICDAMGTELGEVLVGVFDEPMQDFTEEDLDTVAAAFHGAFDDIEALAEPSNMSGEIDAFVEHGHAETDALGAISDLFQVDHSPFKETDRLAAVLDLGSCRWGSG